MISRGTARRQLRAYVVVQKATVTLGVDAGGRTTITGRVTLMNAGQTPAYKIEQRRSIRLVQPKEFLSTEPFGRTMAVLGPRVEHPDDLGTGLVIEEEQRRDLERGGNVYFWGEVTYRDIFKKKRYTRFAVRYPRIVTKLNDVGTIACPDGNDAT